MMHTVCDMPECASLKASPYRIVCGVNERQIDLCAEHSKPLQPILAAAREVSPLTVYPKVSHGGAIDCTRPGGTVTIN